MQQVVNEYDCGRRIDHPGVRRVYDLRRVRRLLAVRETHLLMEYCPDRSLQDSPTKSVLEACGVFAQVAQGIDAINLAGFVHADMKPNNIIITPEGNVKIIDLGQACRIGTVKERIQGTPDFIAPEQVKRGPLGVQTDVFNFGASFYWALTGKCIPTLLPKANSLELPAAGPAVTPPVKHNSDIPPVLNNLVMDCVKVDPSQRPGSMQEVVRRLGIVLRRLVPGPGPSQAELKGTP